MKFLSFYFLSIKISSFLSWKCPFWVYFLKLLWFNFCEGENRKESPVSGLRPSMDDLDANIWKRQIKIFKLSTYPCSRTKLSRLLVKVLFLISRFAFVNSVDQICFIFINILCYFFYDKKSYSFNSHIFLIFFFIINIIFAYIFVFF